MIRILIIDDHQIVRDGLSLYIQNCTNLSAEVVGSVSSGQEAVQFVQQQTVDIILLDDSLPDMAGEDVLQSVLSTHPDVGVVILTSHSSNQTLESLLISGARGVVCKSLGAQDVVDAINTVINGDIYVDASFSSMAIRPLLKEEFRLSERECQILKLMASGCAGYEIAARLSISQKTVSTYKKRIRDKLRAENNMDLIRLAVQYEYKDIGCSE